MIRNSRMNRFYILLGVLLGSVFIYITTHGVTTCRNCYRQRPPSSDHQDGNPYSVKQLAEQHRLQINRLPVFGVCSQSSGVLSHQMIDTEKGTSKITRWQRAAPDITLQRIATTGKGLSSRTNKNAISSSLSTIWQYRGGNPIHLGFMSPKMDSLPSTVQDLRKLSIAWTYGPVNVGIHTASKSSPVVDNATVFVGADKGILYAVDRQTGMLKWKFIARPSKRGIHGTPAVDEQYVFIGDYGGYAYALDKSSGSLIWEVKLGQSIGASPVIVGDRVYWTVEVGSPAADGYLAVVERCTGRVLFYSRPLDDQSHCTPTVLIANNGIEARVYLGANTGRFHCLDGNNGREIWQFETFGLRARDIRLQLQISRQTPIEMIMKIVCEHDKELCSMPNATLVNQKSQIKGTAAVFDDRIVFGSWDRHVYCLNATNGRLLWTFILNGFVMSSAAIDPHERQVFIGSHTGVLVALSLDTGRLIWSLPTHGRLLSSPVLVPLSHNEISPKRLAVIIGSSDQILYITCAQDGRILFKQSLDAGPITNEIAVDSDNAIYISTNNGSLIKLK